MIDSEDESSADEGPKLVDSISTGDLKRKPKVNGIMKKPSKKATDEVKKSPKSPSNGKGFNLLNRLDDIGNISKSVFSSSVPCALLWDGESSIELDLTSHFSPGESYRSICTRTQTTNYPPNFLLAVLLPRNCNPRRSTAPNM